MTLSGTSSVSPAFGAGTQTGPVFSPAVLTGGSRPTAELAKTDATTSGAGAPVSAKAVGGSPAVIKAASVAGGDATSGAAAAAAPGGSSSAPVKTASAATVSAEVSQAAEKAAEARSTAKSAPVGEDGQIRELRSQGQNLSQIAVDLNISVAAVNGDLQTDIPKFVTPPPVADSSNSAHSTISVFA
jgi:hypothetical protein